MRYLCKAAASCLRAAVNAYSRAHTWVLMHPLLRGVGYLLPRSGSTMDDGGSKQSTLRKLRKSARCDSACGIARGTSSRWSVSSSGSARRCGRAPSEAKTP